MFNSDCNFVSESAKAIRSSTFPTKINSLCSGVSADMMADVSQFWGCFMLVLSEAIFILFKQNQSF